MGNDRQAGLRLRTEMNKARIARAKQRSTALAAVACVTVGVVVAVAVLWLAFDVPQVLIGFVAGSTITGFGAMAFWYVDHSAGAQNAKFGAYGEQKTAELFSSKRARRHGWEIRNNLEFEVDDWIEDVDHVVFGPDGVYAIDSKWANATWETRGGAVNAYGRRALGRAEVSARHVRCLLRASGVEVHVVPVLVQWGGGGWPDAGWVVRSFDGVLVFRGDAGARVLDEIEGITGGQLAPDTLHQIRTALDARVEGRPSPAPELLAATSR